MVLKGFHCNEWLCPALIVKSLGPLCRESQAPFCAQTRSELMLKNVVAKGGDSNLRQVYKETKEEVKREEQMGGRCTDD